MSDTAATLNFDFSRYGQMLDHYSEKKEKIYKLNRDLTRESKRIIFSLHRLAGLHESERFAGLKSIEMELLRLRNTCISAIATHIEKEKYFCYTPSYSSGMEEYIEALLFCSFLMRGSLLSFNEALTFLELTPSLKEATPMYGCKTNYRRFGRLVDTGVDTLEGLGLKELSTTPLPPGDNIVGDRHKFVSNIQQVIEAPLPTTPLLHSQDNYKISNINTLDDLKKYSAIQNSKLLEEEEMFLNEKESILDVRESLLVKKKDLIDHKRLLINERRIFIEEKKLFFTDVENFEMHKRDTPVPTDQNTSNPQKVTNPGAINSGSDEISDQYVEESKKKIADLWRCVSPEFYEKSQEVAAIEQQQQRQSFSAAQQKEDREHQSFEVKHPGFTLYRGDAWRWPGDRQSGEGELQPFSCNRKYRYQLLSYNTYILGLSDLSGELMRFYIKSMSVGDVKYSLHILLCLRGITAGYRRIATVTEKYLSQKISVHECNLAKVEDFNYNFSLRRTELTDDQLKEYIKMVAGGEQDRVE